ncbi:Hypothetical protein MAGb_4200 [Mycoplasmopsis agalactiae 14628]|uniref:tRNA-binding domain-containing protein n=1 Tax=Mycoplasmopsis agalactiae 14628 TaxID=1110504 RepID=I5D552_MYCAA|nr:tRNA-binding protein [Mycoplasmopsis agalactiae]EIN14811.1 Hypothetical protein MAGb_4200 [Mycoplasmopsis agalactiae 14628]
MAILFNISSKFENNAIAFFNTNINDSHADFYDDMVVFRDENFNVSSVNLLNYKTADLGKKFKILNTDEYNELEDLILSKSSKYKIQRIKHFIIGKILKREVHPKSQKLFVLEVDFKENKRQIVTNTTYTTEGKYFVWCLPGSITATGLKITEGEILEVKSYGMLCSAQSLGFSEIQAKKLDELLQKCDDSYLGLEVSNLL